MALKPSVVETKNELSSGHTLRTGNHIHDQHTLVIIIVPDTETVQNPGHCYHWCASVLYSDIFGLVQREKFV